MKLFKTKWFVRFARRAKMPDATLREAVERVRRGLIDADLGGGVVKQRVARPGAGTSGGFRILMAYRPEARAVFLYGFAKSERENIAKHELETARELAEVWLGATAAQIAEAVKTGLIEEVGNDDDKTP